MLKVVGIKLTEFNFLRYRHKYNYIHSQLLVLEIDISPPVIYIQYP